MLNSTQMSFPKQTLWKKVPIIEPNKITAVVNPSEIVSYIP